MDSPTIPRQGPATTPWPPMSIKAISPTAIKAPSEHTQIALGLGKTIGIGYLFSSQLPNLNQKSCKLLPYIFQYFISPGIYRIRFRFRCHKLQQSLPESRTKDEGLAGHKYRSHYTHIEDRGNMNGTINKSG